MLVSMISVECKNDFTITEPSGVELIVLESGITYDAIDSGDIITVKSDIKDLTFYKSDFPSSSLEVKH